MWQNCWGEGGRSEREATLFHLSCGVHDFLNCFQVQTLFSTGNPHHNLWCGFSKTVKAVVQMWQNWAETQFCGNMEKTYTVCRPAICLQAVFFWDFLSCGEDFNSSASLKKSQKNICLGKLWCGCGKTCQKLISAPPKKVN